MRNKSTTKFAFGASGSLSEEGMVYQNGELKSPDGVKLKVHDLYISKDTEIVFSFWNEKNSQHWGVKISVNGKTKAQIYPAASAKTRLFPYLRFEKVYHESEFSLITYN